MLLTDTAATAAVTNAVVAIWVLFVPAVAVGAVGAPVRAGEASVATVLPLTFRPPASATTVPLLTSMLAASRALVLRLGANRSESAKTTQRPDTAEVKFRRNELLSSGV